jgi:hypothetical protein
MRVVRNRPSLKMTFWHSRLPDFAFVTPSQILLMSFFEQPHPGGLADQPMWSHVKHLIYHAHAKYSPRASRLV